MQLDDLGFLKLEVFCIWMDMVKYLQENEFTRYFHYDEDGIKIDVDYITEDVKDYEVFLQPDKRGVSVLIFQDFGNQFIPGFIPKEYLENDNWMEDFKKRVTKKKHQIKMEKEANIKKIRKAKKRDMLLLAEELDVFKNGKWMLEKLDEID